MDLCDYSQMRPLLTEVGFHFSKGKGQNFLTAAWVPARIAEQCGADERTGVVEIGPGVGCLTERLAARAGRVLSFEVDERLRPVLAVTLAGLENVEVVFADATRVDLAEEVRTALAGLRPIVCANLPYNLTTPLLTRIFAAGCFETVTVMVQKEFAQRMCAAPGQAEYGAFTLLTQWHASPELAFTVGADCFTPRPKVTSAVVHMTMRREPPFDVDERALFRVVRAAFNQRRKTLENALAGVCGKERARAAIAACALPETVRGEALDLAEFAALTRAIEALG